VLTPLTTLVCGGQASDNPQVLPVRSTKTLIYLDDWIVFFKPDLLIVYDRLNPQPKIDVREWHVVAKTTEKRPDGEFLLVVRPWKVAEMESVPKTDVIWKRDGNELIVEAVVNGKV
jgi:hypothetical protein